MAIVIALTNQKGGVGKTTTSSALASGLASFYDKKVLAIDLDPQGSLGFSLGLDIEECSTIYDVLTRKTSIREAIQTTDYCDIITSNILLSGAELEFTSADRELLLKDALQPVLADYDYVIIDTPPALNILTLNAYAAADHLIIPMAPEVLSLLGVTQLRETINSVRQTVNKGLDILGIVLTRFNGRTLLAREVKEMAESVAGQMGTKVFDRQIRASVAVAEAPAHGTSVYDHAPKSNSSQDYRAFVEEVLTRTSNRQKNFQEVG